MQIFGYCHIHSKYSDGDLSLEKIKRIFSYLGASFIFVTEHTDNFTKDKARNFINDCQRLSNNNFLIIPGLEISIGKNHILVLGTPNYYEDNNIIYLLNKYKNDNCLLVWAHPHRGNHQVVDSILGLIDGIEIWNSVYDTKHAPRYSTLNYVKKNYQKNWLLFPGLDFHRSSHSPGPAIFLSLNQLNQEEIIRKMKINEYQIGNKIKLNKNDVLGKKYYYLFFLNLFFIIILTILRMINSVLLSFNIKAPIRIKNYLRKYI
jgi:hypothetical protein